jgi:hypothetical protein
MVFIFVLDQCLASPGTRSIAVYEPVLPVVARPCLLVFPTRPLVDDAGSGAVWITMDYYETAVHQAKGVCWETYDWIAHVEAGAGGHHYVTMSRRPGGRPLGFGRDGDDDRHLYGLRAGPEARERGRAAYKLLQTKESRPGRVSGLCCPRLKTRLHTHIPVRVWPAHTHGHADQQDFQRAGLGRQHKKTFPLSITGARTIQGRILVGSWYQLSSGPISPICSRRPHLIGWPVVKSARLREIAGRA